MCACPQRPTDVLEHSSGKILRETVLVSVLGDCSQDIQPSAKEILKILIEIMDRL
ncbi:hypothetical protein DPMN_013928 [Dreissena polymorpha]|uniref:Uncharacterized protein n=1 Tax=Dreissena polymorpha TaxID=45954 RepID=A0A9D4S4R8_DREPO|nr:hypothetical protein DPMN_193156 [Dreissena polymorpha]KAH3729153.1 hypothetical protein DPMN_055117 [Dreissena polymorpha]KAH3889862.1 hypothetical protein DPMN_013928 [Dreissena polymorpha]